MMGCFFKEICIPLLKYQILTAISARKIYTYNYSGYSYFIMNHVTKRLHLIHVLTFIKIYKAACTLRLLEYCFCFHTTAIQAHLANELMNT